MSLPEKDTTNLDKTAPVTDDSIEREPTGMPWFRTWKSVYVFVLGSFLLYIVLLAIFSRAFS